MRELRSLAERHGASAMEELTGEAEERLWREVAALSAPTAPAGCVRIRVCVAPAELGAVLDDVHIRAHRHGLRLAMGARGCNGVLYLLAEGSAAGLRSFFTELAAHWPHAQLLAAAPEVADGLPVWGAAPPAASLMRALKGAIDPLNQMSPGSYIT
jgi:FAD/FMN-containing dehydrogenase